jgi:hypothetical protein
VVGLADDRKASALEPLDQPELPERLGAVELLGEDPRRQLSQLVLTPRRRQRRVAYVVVEVQVGVVHPDRPALAVWDEPQLLAEAWDEVEARADVISKLRVLGWGALEQGGGGDVHVRAVLFEVEKRGIESSQAVGHAPIFP